MILQNLYILRSFYNNGSSLISQWVQTTSQLIVARQILLRREQQLTTVRGVLIFSLVNIQLFFWDISSMHKTVFSAKNISMCEAM